mgnify:CR=1 FL=1
MSDWRIPQEYLDQSKRIEELEAALAKSCEDGRNEMYDCGYNALKAENERLRAVYEAAIRVVNGNSALAHQDLGEALAAVQEKQE